MPYKIEAKGDQFCVVKSDSGETVHCHPTREKALAQLRALYANVNDSAFTEFSMAIVKANTDKNGVMRWRAVASDTGEDYFGERMSKELFQDFITHINNEDEIPEPFKSVICEEDWCGGMPYISIAHYKSGAGKVNVPGEPNKIYLDGDSLKSTGILYDTPLGNAVFKSLQKDLVEKRDDKVRISIGFLDLEHSHGEKFTFTRKSLTDKCPLCKEGVGDKIYKKGFLVHEALTRIPANPRTDVEVEKSMTTKREDAESIIEDEEVIKGLDLKSQAENVLVIKSDMSMDEMKKKMEECPDEECRKKMEKMMADKKAMMEMSTSDETDNEPVADEPIVEEAARKDVSPADKKRAEKEYGDVAYADEANKKYPIDTEEHVRAALSYWGMPKNREKYSPEDQKKIGAKIHAAAKRFKIEVAKSDVEENTENTEFLASTTDPRGYKETSTPAPVYESPIEKSFAVLKSKIESVKSQGLTGDAALKEVQSDFDSIGEVIKAEFTPKPSPEEIAAKTMETTLRSLLAEMLPQALAQTVAPIQSKLETLEGELRAKSLTTVSPKEKVETVQRSLTPSLVQKAAIEGVAKKSISQFDLIARQSVGLQQ